MPVFQLPSGSSPKPKEASLEDRLRGMGLAEEGAYLGRIAEMANRANKARAQIIKAGVGAVSGAFDQIGRATGLSTWAFQKGTELAGEMITPRTDMTPTEMGEEAAFNLAPSPLAFGGVYTKRVLATMKALGEEAMDPPAKGMVRLFRGEPSFSALEGEWEGGQWFTDAVDLARDFRDLTKDGRLIYIDVPKKDLAEYIVERSSEGSTYFLPTELEAKAMMVGPHPGKLTRSLARGDLEAGVPFRNVAGGGNRLVKEGIRGEILNERNSPLMDLDVTLTKLKAIDEPAAQELYKQGRSLLSNYPDFGHNYSSAKLSAITDDYAAFNQAVRKAFPEILTNKFPGDIGQIVVKRQIIDESGPHAFADIRAQRRGEYPLAPKYMGEDSRIQAIEEEAREQGPMAFGPHDWVLDEETGRVRAPDMTIRDFILGHEGVREEVISDLVTEYDMTRSDADRIYRLTRR